MDEKNHEIFVHQVIEASLDFDRERFEKMVNSLCCALDLKYVSALFSISSAGVLDRYE